MEKLLHEPLFYIFFVYGMSFILVFIMILKSSMKSHSAPIVSEFYLLALFGLTHGITELLDWVRFILKATGQGNVVVLNILSQTFLVVSFVSLLQFGINLLTLDRERKKLVRSSPLALIAVFIVIVLARKMDDVFAIGLLARYSFGFAGALISALALVSLARSLKFLGNRKLLTGLNSAATAFACYAVFGGLILQPIFGMPIQLFRSACAIAIAASSFAILDMYIYVKGTDQVGASVAACAPSSSD